MIGAFILTTLVSAVSARGAIAAVDGITSITEEWIDEKQKIRTKHRVAGILVEIKTTAQYRILRDGIKELDSIVSSFDMDPNTRKIIRHALLLGLMDWSIGKGVIGAFIIPDEKGNALLDPDQAMDIQLAFSIRPPQSHLRLWQLGTLVREARIPEQKGK